MEDQVSDSIVEGVGNEVLIVLVTGFVTLMLTLAWYSTSLTNSQARLTPVRVQRNNVILNRLSGSSTAEARTASQSAASSSTPSQATEFHAHTSEEAVRNENAEQVETLGQDASTSDTVPANDGEAESASLEPHTNQSHNDATQLPTNSAATANEVTSEEEQANDVSSQHGDQQSKTEETGAVTETSDDTPSPETITSDIHPAPDDSEAGTVPGEEGVETSPDNIEAEEPAADTEDTIQIRLKFITDSERLTRARITDTIRDFKRCNFAEEQAANKLVRLIANGQELQDPKTLQYYNIMNNTTIHALISESAANTSTPTSQPDVVMLNAGALMVPLFTTMLGILWYLRYEHGELFNITSTLSLACITGVFIFCLLAQHRSSNTRNTNRERNINVTTHIRDNR